MPPAQVWDKQILDYKSGKNLIYWPIMSRIWQKSKKEKGLEITSDKATGNIKLLTILAAVVCTAVLLTHWRALSARAITFDDNQYFTENSLVQNPSSASAWRFLSEVLRPSSVEGYYQPLTMISLMCDYALGGREDNLLPVHRSSLILHIINTALIIILIYNLFGVPWTAAAAGLLFGLHPMTVEVIAWVGERKTLLAAFFALWSLIFYVRFARGGGWKFYFGCFAAYILALMSKPTSVPLPMLLVLLDWWPLRRFTPAAFAAGSEPPAQVRGLNALRLLIEKIPLFVIGGVFAIITAISQKSTAVLVTPGGYDLQRIILILCHNIIFYPAKMLYPVNLSPHYIFPEPMSLSNPAVLFGVMGTCVLIPLLLISLRWTRGAMTGWLFFFIAILPTMQILQFSTVIASDKYAYLPVIGFLAALAAFGGWICEAGGSDKYNKRCLATALVVLILGGAEAAGTVKYLGLWQNTFSLYEHMLSLTPNSPPLHFGIANEFAKQGKTDEAISHYKLALAVELETRESVPPDFYIFSHFNLANMLKSTGRVEEAIFHYNKALGYYRRAILVKPNKQKISVELAKTLTNLANAYSQQGKSHEAIKCFREAIQFNPNSAIAYSNLGWELENIKEFDEAMECFSKAMNLNPKMMSALMGMAGAYSATRQFDKAAETAQKALDIAIEGGDNVMINRIREQLKQYQHFEKGN
jgi:protein O-mannosyl-transferase